MNKFLKTLDSCLLCLRFPFLYPRNRFTGKNIKNILHHQLYKLSEASIQKISITGKLVTEENRKKYYSSYANFTNNRIRLNRDEKTLTIGNNIEVKNYSIKQLLWSDDRFEILGLELVFSICGNPVVQVIVETKDKNDKANYGFRYDYVELVTNKWLHFWYKVTLWFDEEFFDRILFIPTYTELDAMPEGWKKAFGIQMCKEIRAQLVKEHFLFKYRITQIKEKFGGLRWYDECSSREIKDIISKYEELSHKTCIICGKPATKMSKGWICPYCDECFEKINI